MLPNQQCHLSKLHYRRQELKNELEHLGKKKKKKHQQIEITMLFPQGLWCNLKANKAPKLPSSKFHWRLKITQVICSAPCWQSHEMTPKNSPTAKCDQTQSVSQAALRLQETCASHAAFSSQHNPWPSWPAPPHRSHCSVINRNDQAELSNLHLASSFMFINLFLT